MYLITTPFEACGFRTKNQKHKTHNKNKNTALSQNAELSSAIIYLVYKSYVLMGYVSPKMRKE